MGVELFWSICLNEWREHWDRGAGWRAQVLCCRRRLQQGSQYLIRAPGGMKCRSRPHSSYDRARRACTRSPKIIFSVLCMIAYLSASRSRRNDATIVLTGKLHVRAFCIGTH